MTRLLLSVGDGIDTAATLAAMTPPPLSLRLRAERYDLSLRQRLDNVVPKLMDRHGIDAWVLVAREYNEDPVFRALVSPTTMGSPTTVFVSSRRSISSTAVLNSFSISSIGHLLVAFAFRAVSWEGGSGAVSSAAPSPPLVSRSYFFVGLGV